MYMFSKDSIRRVNKEYIIDCTSKSSSPVFDKLIGDSIVMDFKTYTINKVRDIKGNKCKVVCTIKS